MFQQNPTHRFDHYHLDAHCHLLQKSFALENAEPFLYEKEFQKDIYSVYFY